MGLFQSTPTSTTSEGARERLKLIAENASIEKVQALLRHAIEKGITSQEAAGLSEPSELFPVCVRTPAGEVVFEDCVPGKRTVRSLLQTLRNRASGRPSLLHGTQVLSQSTKISELGLTGEDCLYLIRKATGTYTPWSDGDKDALADHLVKCLLIGAAQAGKTSWLQAFSRHDFSEEYKATIGVEFKLLRLQAEDGRKLKIQLWDTAGQPRFRPITSAYFRGSSGLMAFFSLKSRATLDEVLTMLESAQKEHPSCCRCICLVATHADIPDPEVAEAEAEQLAKEKRWSFFAVSSKTNGGDYSSVDDPLYSWLDLYMDTLGTQ